MIAWRVFLQNWTKRASMVTARNLTRDRRQGSDPQCLLCVSQQQKNGHSKHGTVVVYEVEKSDSVGDETTEAATEIRQGHRGHVNRV